MQLFIIINKVINNLNKLLWKDTFINVFYHTHSSCCEERFFCSRLPSYSRQVLSSQDLKSVIGVTLEIFEIGNDQETRAPDEFCCKARVTQRFRLLEISPTQSRRYVECRCTLEIL